MVNAADLLDEKPAVALLLELLKIEGPSGREKDVALAVREMLLDAGVPQSSIMFDDANTKMPDPSHTGNLIVRLPGKGRARLLAANLDTVPIAVGVKPKMYGLWISSDGMTALGADDRAGVAVLVAATEALLKNKIEHPPLTLLFTVREEGGTWGARFVNQQMLGAPEFAFSFDGREPERMVVAAPSSDKFSIVVHGKESHAGTAPEKGVSAIEIAASAISQLRAAGWLGRIQRGKKEGTSNIGAIEGGSASNIVPGDVRMKAEARSHDPKFLSEITKTFKETFRRAAKTVTSADGKTGSVRFEVHRTYNSFSLPPNNVAVTAAAQAITAAGMKPTMKSQNGGLDACWLNEYGIPTVTLGTGTFNNHTKQERLNVPDYLNACRVALLLATLPFK